MRRGRSGNAAIELAMWLPILLLLITGVIQFGKITYIYYSLKKTVNTVAVVDALSPNTATPMTVLGFRQFLVQPAADGTFFNPSDANGRFVATYLGSPMPLRQGNIDDRYQFGFCPVTSGPGKVVLH